MSEASLPHEPIHDDDNVVQFERKQTTLRSLYASDMTSAQIETALETLDQGEIRRTGEGSRPTYILNSVLLALNITPEMNSLFRPDQSIDHDRRADALHGLGVDKTVTRVLKAFDELSATLERADMTEYRGTMMEEVDEKMSETNLYRAFSHLTQNVTMSREVRANGVVQAYRLSYALLYDYILQGQPE